MSERIEGFVSPVPLHAASRRFIMLPNDKHVRVELERLAEQQQHRAETRLLTTAAPRPVVVRKVAGWLGPRFTAWGTQLEAYSRNIPSRLLPNS